MPIVAGGAPTKQKELPPPSAEELADFQEAFDNFDRDKSGSIDKRELATVMRSLGYTPSEKQIAKILAIADKDNDGEISFEEFVDMMRSSEMSTDYEQEMKRAFQIFDNDGNGYITKGELSRIMRNLGAKLSDAEIKLLIAEADQDGDGQISAKEFISFVYSGKDK